MDDHGYSSDSSISTERCSASIDDSARVVRNSFFASMVSMLKGYILPTPSPPLPHAPLQPLRIHTATPIRERSPVNYPTTPTRNIASSSLRTPPTPLSPVNRPSTSAAIPDTPESLAEERRPFHTPSPSPCRSSQESTPAAALPPVSLNDVPCNSRIDNPSTCETSVPSVSKARLDFKSTSALNPPNNLTTENHSTSVEETEDIHRKYWDCKREDRVSDACPVCGERFSTGWSRRTHYLQLHYDRYFSAVTHHEANSVVGRILGSSSETNVNFVNWRDEYCSRTRVEDHPAARVCLLCRGTSKVMRLYNGPRRLLAHVEKAHPTVARSLKQEYRVVCSRGSHVSNLELHQLLIAPRLPLVAPKRRAENSVVETTPKRPRMETQQ